MGVTLLSKRVGSVIRRLFRFYRPKKRYPPVIRCTLSMRDIRAMYPHLTSYEIDRLKLLLLEREVRDGVTYYRPIDVAFAYGYNEELYEWLTNLN